MLRWLILALLPLVLQAEDRWIVIRSGPFEVYSAAGDRPARETMNRLEQFRHALGITLGKDDPHLLWPVRLLIFKNPQPPVFGLAREGYVVTGLDGHLGDLARLLIEQNTRRLPPFIEQGLIAAFSTLEVSGTHITVGAPPSQRTRDWARMRLLLCNPDYAGRSRVMISNLEEASDLAVAYRNAFEKTQAQIEKQVDTELAAGTSGTGTISGLALSPSRDFDVHSADPDSVKLIEADLLLAAGSSKAEAAYNALHGPGAAEGLGLLALKADKKDEARRLFASAIQSDTKSARVYVEAAALQADDAKAIEQLQKAAELNPLWALPAYRRALVEKDLDAKSAQLKKATALEPRNVQYWEALARNETAAARFIDAQKAWGGAEKAAASDEERQEIRQIRLSLQAERAEHEAAERKRKAEEEARELQRVKDASMASIRASETSARKRLNPDGAPPPKAEEWWSGPDAGGKAEGLLQKLDCMGSIGRMTIQTSDGKTVQLLVGDPGKLAISGVGGDQASLACGLQKPPRKVLVLFNPKSNKKLGTSGEAVSIEFR